MSNLTEVFLVGLEVGGNYVKCLVIVIISVGLGGAKRCGENFKVITLRRGGTNHKEGTSLYGES